MIAINACKRCNPNISFHVTVRVRHLTLDLPSGRSEVRSGHLQVADTYV